MALFLDISINFAGRFKIERLFFIVISFGLRDIEISMFFFLFNSIMNRLYTYIKEKKYRDRYEELINSGRFEQTWKLDVNRETSSWTI